MKLLGAILAGALAACGSRTKVLEPPPSPPGIDAGAVDAAASDRPHGWLSAADSTYKNLPRTGKCLKAVGCPFKPAPLPLCPANTKTTPLQEAIDVFVPASTSITVSTRIWFEPPTEKTLAGCVAEACCTVLVGKFFFADNANLVSSVDQRAFPWNDQYPDAFAWIGDVTGRCAGIDVQDGQPIVVTGELVHPSGGGAFEILAPELCVLEGEQ